MNKIVVLALTLTLNTLCYAQNVNVSTLLRNINASGGVTTDRYGNVYVSDFGPILGNTNQSTTVYKWSVKTGNLTKFANGFKGASGACFDNQGNFYQSNPFGNSITKISEEGKVDHNWFTDSLKTPIGLVADNENIFVCNCRGNSIGKITKDKVYEEYVSSNLFKCPNGLTKDNEGNLYTCNFQDGKILKISKSKEVSILAELPVLFGGPSPVGNGHLVWSNELLYVATIGSGEIYKIAMDSKVELIAGKAFAFTNIDGTGDEATFSKPNGIATSITGDTLYVNVSDDAWNVNPQGLHPAHLRIITGICSLPGVRCPEGNKN